MPPVKVHHKAENLPISDASAPTGNLGTLEQARDWLTNRMKAVMGTTSWRDAPPTTLQDAKNHIDAANPHTGSAPVSHVGSRDGHPLVTPTLDGFMSGADKTKLDGLGTGGTTTDNSKLTTSDFLGDYVVSGLLPAVPSPASLSMGIPGGTAYAGGMRVVKGAEAARTYTASVDTYVDLSSGGVYAYVEVANGAAAPALTGNSIRLFMARTDATAITGVTDFRRLKPITKAHNHGIGDLPVPQTAGAAAGASEVVRGDDLRLVTYYKFFRAGSTASPITGVGWEPVFEARTLNEVRVRFNVAPTDATTVVVQRSVGGAAPTDVASVSVAASALQTVLSGISVTLAAGDALRVSITAGGTGGSDATVVCRAA